MNQTPVCAKQPSRVLSAVQLFALVFISSLQGRELWLRRVEHLTMTTKAKLFFSLSVTCSIYPTKLTTGKHKLTFTQDTLELSAYCRAWATTHKSFTCVVPGQSTKHYILFQHQPVSYRHSCIKSHLEAAQLNNSHSTPDSRVELFSLTCLPLSSSSSTDQFGGKVPCSRAPWVLGNKEPECKRTCQYVAARYW